MPQIAGLLSDKSKLELYCVDCPAEDLKKLKRVVKDWDLSDFVKLITIKANEVSKYSYQLSLVDDKLTLCKRRPTNTMEWSLSRKHTHCLST